ncbi:GldG family protein [candidate division KSB1 bacterium]
MEKINKQYFGILGIVLLLISIIMSSINSEWTVFSKIMLYLGILLFGGYVIIDFKSVKRFFLKRSSRYGSNAIFSILLVLLILSFMNFIFNKRNIRIDLTSSKQFSLSHQTVNILKNLEKNVNITAFFQSNNQTVMEDLLNEFSFQSDKFSFSFIDPDKKPAIAENYGIKAYNTTVLECGEKMEKITETSEEVLTNALIRVTRESKKVLYFTEGHAEHDVDSEERDGYKRIRDKLVEENYDIKKIFPARENNIPEDCAVLIINGPKSELFKSELDSIDSYLNRGGKVLFLIDPKPAPGMAEFFDKWGIEVGDDIVIDMSGIGRLFGAGPEMPLVNNFGTHAIVKDMKGAATFFPFARSISLKIPMSPEIRGQFLTKTTPRSFGETELKGNQAEFNEGKDKRGPLDLGVVVEKNIPGTTLKTGSLVVFGDSDFANNVYGGMQKNGDLFLNAVNWLAEEEDLVSIRAKDPEDRRVNLTPRQGKIVFYFSIIFLPIAVLLIGFAVFLNRRKL